jgi:hypothetical protein
MYKTLIPSFMDNLKELSTQGVVWPTRDLDTFQNPLDTTTTTSSLNRAARQPQFHAVNTSSLEYGVDSPHDVVLDTLLLLLILDLLNTGASRVLIHTWAADQLSLVLPHASVDVDILDFDPQRTVRRNREPAVDLPHQV